MYSSSSESSLATYFSRSRTQVEKSFSTLESAGRSETTLHDPTIYELEGSLPSPSDGESLSDISPPPDGGLQAWLQVLGSFFLFFGSLGVFNTYGAFQTYYETKLLADHSTSSIAWIGTVAGLMLFSGGIFVGPLFDKGYLRTLLITGTVFVVFGLMMTSLATKYYQVFLAQAICFGLGCSCLFLPSTAIVVTYFTTRRSMATGITAAGSSIGALIFPITFRQLVSKIGFGWTTRLIALMVLARPMFDKTAFTDIKFVVLCAALFCSFTGMYFPFFYIASYVTSALKKSEDLGFYTLAITNGASIFGRVGPGLLADRIGALNTVLPSSVVVAALTFSWLAIDNFARTLVFACLFGFMAGTLVSLPTSIVAALTPNVELAGTRLGYAFMFAGIGLLIGNPIAGILLDIRNGIFWKGQVFSGSFIAVGTVFYTILRAMIYFERRKEGGGWKI